MRQKKKDSLPKKTLRETFLTGKIKVALALTLTVSFLTLSTGAAKADNDLSDFGFGARGSLNVSSLTSGWDVATSGYSLADVDLFSGMITGPEFGQSLNDDYSMQSGLLTNDQLAFDASRLAEASRKEAEAKRLAEEEKKKNASIAGAGAQGEVDATGCPVNAPANTMRSGSSSIGVAELCARSVAQARSPQAAQAIKYMLNHLGLPYSQPKRNLEGWYDCSSYTTRAYQSAGVNIAPPGQNAPSTRTMRVARWAVQIPLSEAKPGDLVQPTSGHVVMKLSDGWMVHTARPGDVSHVASLSSNSYWVAYVDPARV